MGSYHPHRDISRRPNASASRKARTPLSANLKDTAARREQIAHERERHAQRIAAEREARRRLDSNRQARAAARREQRASDALRADARSNLEARAGTLFPWNLMAPDREIAAILTGQRRGSQFPIFDLARLFARVNLGVSPREFGVSGPAENFMMLSAPRTRSWTALTNTADFFIEATAFEGRAFDRTALLDKARRTLADLEACLSMLPDWLTIHELRGPWFLIRPTPETAEAMWTDVLASKSAAGP
jgi:hypothetical protein